MAEIYGEAFTETAKDALTTLLTALITDMASDDPAIEYVYDRHDKAVLLLNSATIELEEIAVEPKFTNHNEYYTMTFSIRTHTAYLGGVRDANKNRRLLNSIINKLQANVTLTPEYRIELIHSVSPLEDYYFTVGGSMFVDVTVTITHTQE